MTNLHAAIPEEKLTEAYRLLLEMRDNCVKHADDQYDDPKRKAKYEALNIAMAAMGRSIPPRWISVEERLPEPKEDVALYIRCGDVSFIRTGWRMGNGQFICPNDSLSGYEVTHWMHLPKPPEEPA
jgi:hypothetical protein